MDVLVCLVSRGCDGVFGDGLYYVENAFVYLDGFLAEIFVSGGVDGVGAGGCAGSCGGDYCVDWIDLEKCVYWKSILLSSHAQDSLENVLSGDF